MVKKLTELERYKKAYDILMGYWGDIPNEYKKDVDKELKELGL